jgi:hypothetical protein
MAETATSASTAGSLALPAIPSTAAMDRDFIERNHIVERYLAGKLPLKGAQDFERYCRDNPELLDELRLTERVHAGLRLLDAGRVALPWEEKPRKFWERLPVFVALSALAAALGVLALVQFSGLGKRDAQIAALQTAATTRPLDAPVSTQSIRLVPNRTAPSRNAAVTISGTAKMADLKIDMSWSRHTAFRVTVDRIDQGRAMVLHNLLRDSNGQLRIAVNSTALGPGSYQFAIEGMTLQGATVPQAWVTVGISR